MYSDFLFSWFYHMINDKREYIIAKNNNHWPDLKSLFFAVFIFILQYCDKGKNSHKWLRTRTQPREQSLLMPGDGAEHMWRGHEKFLNY